MNLVDLQQKIDNYVRVVGSWVRNVGKIYFSPTPENVEVEIINDSGAIVTKTMPNVAMFRKQVWDDVGDAMGQMSQTFYVDASAGDDSNSGRENAPFKTIKKAIQSGPTGGTVMVYLKAGQVHRMETDITVNTFVTRFRTWGGVEEVSENNAWIANVSYVANDQNNATRFNRPYGYMSAHFVNFVTADAEDPSLPIDVNASMFFGTLYSTITATIHSGVVKIGDTNVFRKLNSNTAFSNISLTLCDIKQVGANSAGNLVSNAFGNMFISDKDSTVTLLDGSAGSISDLLSGQIIRDASTNIPLNWVTNFEL